MTEKNQEATLQSIRERYPITKEEEAWLPQGVRLARFVGDWDCAGCGLATMDHTVEWRFPSKVCLKDLYTKNILESKGEHQLARKDEKQTPKAEKLEEKGGNSKPILDENREGSVANLDEKGIDFRPNLYGKGDTPVGEVEIIGNLAGSKPAAAVVIFSPNEVKIDHVKELVTKTVWNNEDRQLSTTIQVKVQMSPFLLNALIDLQHEDTPLYLIIGSLQAGLPGLSEETGSQQLNLDEEWKEIPPGDDAPKPTLCHVCGETMAPVIFADPAAGLQCPVCHPEITLKDQDKS